MDNICRKYFTIRQSKNGTIIHRNETAINQSLHYKGYLVILSNTVKDASETLFIYRTKDNVEKAFDNLKNNLDLHRLRGGIVPIITWCGANYLFKQWVKVCCA